MRQYNRREFLEGAVGGAMAAPFLSARALRAQEKTIRLGLIGCGWYGMVDVQAALKAGGVEIVVLCDVDSGHLKQSADKVESLQGKRPQTFKLYQELLEAKGLDAVIIATPPHWHALQFIAAMERNLDCYCEKPMAYDIREARAMVEAARKSGRIVQIGFQRRQAAAIRQAREYIQAGAAGRIVQVDVQIHYEAVLKDPTPKAPPAELDWDLWCGPGPKIPYSDQVGHVNWRLEKTSGHGHLVDWGIHLIDATRWILGEKSPRSVVAAGGIYQLAGKITTPDALTASFEFEKCPVTWRHRLWGAEEYTPEISNGILFYGDKETVFVTDNKWVAMPRGKGKERKVHEASSEAGLLQMADFLEAVRTRRQPSCGPEEGFLSTAAVKLAMISYETGSKVTWDAAREQIVGNVEASKLLKRDYRAPYQHPYRG
jgi:predicted dehydrogenase